MTAVILSNRLAYASYGWNESTQDQPKKHRAPFFRLVSGERAGEYNPQHARSSGAKQAALFAACVVAGPAVAFRNERSERSTPGKRSTPCKGPIQTIWFLP